MGKNYIVQHLILVEFYHAVNNTFFFLKFRLLNSSLHGKIFYLPPNFVFAKLHMHVYTIIYSNAWKWKQDFGIILQAKVQSLRLGKTWPINKQNTVYFKFKVERLFGFFFTGSFNLMLHPKNFDTRFYNLRASRF